MVVVDGGLVLVVVVSSVAVLVLVMVARSTAVDVVSAIAGTVVTETRVLVGRATRGSSCMLGWLRLWRGSRGLTGLEGFLRVRSARCGPLALVGLRSWWI